MDTKDTTTTTANTTETPATTANTGTTGTSDTIDRYARYVITSSVKSIEPVVVERASGAEVYAQDGRTYLDCFAGIAVVNAGHVHPRVAEAAKAQIDRLVHGAALVYY
ncbi:MAG TPA: aminotransferase class III-fold pyridoxal phosphate-dependent enzyme, partial [Ktedonobacterales bacterium]|nr:aminotransferase class III-fold pyridoxal phosphate-dependent enzyme [Ktedonobacterales bacterium]